MSDGTAVPVPAWDNKPVSGDPLPYRYLIWIKGGLPKGFTNAAEAAAFARETAGNLPGRVVGVYEIIGYSQAPLVKGDYRAISDDMRALLAEQRPDDEVSPRRAASVGFRDDDEEETP